MCLIAKGFLVSVNSYNNTHHDIAEELLKLVSNNSQINQPIQSIKKFLHIILDYAFIKKEMKKYTPY